jgi:hypothetical protein
LLCIGELLHFALATKGNDLLGKQKHSLGLALVQPALPVSSRLYQSSRTSWREKKQDHQSKTHWQQDEQAAGRDEG